MGYIGSKPGNQVVDGSLIADGTITPADLSTGRPFWDTSGNVGIGTNSPTYKIEARSDTPAFFSATNGDGTRYGFTNALPSNSGNCYVGWIPETVGTGGVNGDLGLVPRTSAGANIRFFTGTTSASERIRIDSSGNLLVGKTTTDDTVTGISLEPSQFESYNFTQGDGTGSGWVIMCNRQGSDGSLITFRQANTTEGNITVSGTTVSYNGGHLARWSQLPDGSKDDTLLKGTVLTNLDEMCIWTKDGEQLPNEQLNKMKVSDVEGDTNVAGVFVNWTRDEDCNTDDMNIAMTGDMIIRIAEGVVVQKGDLLMSAGDGTAKPQDDDIVRSKTIAKVTSNHVTCTYGDGSYCVPCVLMAC